MLHEVSAHNVGQDARSVEWVITRISSFDILRAQRVQVTNSLGRLTRGFSTTLKLLPISSVAKSMVEPLSRERDIASTSTLDG